MADSKSLKNCRILVRDSVTGTLLADTNIQDYDARRNTLTIRKDALTGPADNKLSLLVLGRSEVLEYSGNMRKMANSIDVEIAIFGEKKKEDRNFTRYDMKAEGRVEAVIVGEERIELRKPVVMSVVNISANGILFRADADALYKGAKVRVHVGIKGNDFISEYEVVRFQNRNKETAEYGCRNILPDGEKEAPKVIKMQDMPVVHAEGEAKEELSYDELQQQLEQYFGYAEWLTCVRELQGKGKVDPEADREKLDRLVDTLYEQLGSMDYAAALNCIHRTRPEAEKRERFALNLALISGMMGWWMQLPESIVKKLMEMGLMEQTHAPEGEEAPAPALYYRILSVAEMYDTRASHPNHAKAVIPLVFLEQMRYRGMNQPTGSVKMLEWVLAENILHCVSHRKVLLGDQSVGEILYILPNDMGHPVISVNGKNYQEPVPWNLQWIVVKTQEEEETEAETEAETETGDENEVKDEAEAETEQEAGTEGGENAEAAG